jgi:nucleoside-triphosphatase
MIRTKFFLTGPPGSGKSTVMLRCVDVLREHGFSVGGVATPEIRSGGLRTGFSVVDIASSRRAIMATVNVDSRFRVGKYGVDLEAFESVALQALDHAEKKCDIVCIDEIGRMELFSKPFKEKVEALIDGSKPVIAVLHRSYSDVYGRSGTLLNVSPENREQLPRLVIERMEECLRGDPFNR